MKRMNILGVAMAFVLVVMAPYISIKDRAYPEDSTDQIGETRWGLVPDPTRVAVLLTNPDSPPQWDSLA